jgi:methanogenic corrinoid protein MtbC1
MSGAMHPHNLSQQILTDQSVLVDTIIHAMPRNVGDVSSPKISQPLERHLPLLIEYLAYAIANQVPNTFVQYILWVKSVLEARNVVDSLVPALKVVAQVLTQRYDDAYPAVVQIDEALNALSNPQEHNVYHMPVPSLLKDAYLQAILNGNRTLAKEHIMDAFHNGMTLPTIYVDVIQPALYDVGRLWEQGKVSVAQEHLATAITQTILANIYQEMAMPEMSSQTALVACLEGNHHQVGARMIADMMHLKGIDTFFLGANTPVDSFCEMIDQHKPDYVAVSATLAPQVTVIEKTIERIRADFVSYRPLIMVGGIPFNMSQDLWKKVGGDVWGENAEIAVQRLID